MNHRFPTPHTLTDLWLALRSRLVWLMENREAGYTTETVIITAALAGVALTFGAVFVPKLIAAISGIAV